MFFDDVGDNAYDLYVSDDCDSDNDRNTYNDGHGGVAKWVMT